MRSKTQWVPIRSDSSTDKDEQNTHGMEKLECKYSEEKATKREKMYLKEAETGNTTYEYVTTHNVHITFKFDTSKCCVQLASALPKGIKLALYTVRAVAEKAEKDHSKALSHIL